jgi:hypothetical protein
LPMVEICSLQPTSANMSLSLKFACVSCEHMYPTSSSFFALSMYFTQGTLARFKTESFPRELYIW